MTTQQQAAFATLLSCALMAAGQTSAPPVKDDLFAGTEKFAQGATSVTQIDMDPDSLGKVEGKDGLKAHRTVLSVVHTYEYDKPGMYKIEDVEAFRKKLQSNDWHCSVHIREMKTGESTDVCNKRRDDGLNEQAIITVEPKSLTFIHTIGAGRPAVPIGLGLMGPELQIQMAVMQAELQAEMDTLRPELSGLAGGMKNFTGLDAEQMRQLRKDLRGLGDMKTPAPSPAPQP